MRFFGFRLVDAQYLLLLLNEQRVGFSGSRCGILGVQVATGAVEGGGTASEVLRIASHCCQFIKTLPRLALPCCARSPTQ